ncbi:hypothetical protein C2G38_2219325 [Gigaspora rosea]|uniref:Uncharacterized protein n=1 Tax=Gigaspora rosea TaxID=44941 RepID=A0A397U5R9_9GLOM|nr:hypothetical protein C2G38_2219325 [Gigaspora rosea]
MKAEVKWQLKEKESDLSSQVLDVSGCVYKRGKAALPATCIPLLKYSQGNLEELPRRSISRLLSKMKNYRGAASQNVRHAIWQTFGSEKLLSLNSNTSAPEIVNWKKSSQVAACFRSLFEQTESGVYWIDMIARSAFFTAALPTMTPEHCVFMLAVCDIILNPKSKYVKCTEKLMKRRLKRYLVSI